jgi:hypothetical protein
MYKPLPEPAAPKHQSEGGTFIRPFFYFKMSKNATPKVYACPDYLSEPSSYPPGIVARASAGANPKPISSPTQIIFPSPRSDQPKRQ